MTTSPTNDPMVPSAGSRVAPGRGGVLPVGRRASLLPSLDLAVAGQALTISQPHRKFGKAYAAFVGHAGNGKHVLVRKLIASTWRARWTKPLRVERASVVAVHTTMAQEAAHG